MSSTMRSASETLDDSIKATRVRGLCVLYGNTTGMVETVAPMDLAAAGSIFFTRPRLNHHTRTREEIVKRVDDLFGGLQGRIAEGRGQQGVAARAGGRGASAAGLARDHRQGAAGGELMAQERAGDGGAVHETHAPPSLLFSPFRLRGVTFPNRIVISPMQMYKAAPDGKLNDWHFQHLAKYAIGGAGTVMTEALCVDPIGRNTYGDCGIWSDDHVPPLRRIVDFLHGEGRLAAAQLHHCGPKASRQRPWEGLGPLGAAEAARGEPPWQPVSSTAGATTDGWLSRAPCVWKRSRSSSPTMARARAASPRPVSTCSIFMPPTATCIHSFLSPVANTRNDAYGGDLEGRMRLALEIAEFRAPALAGRQAAVFPSVVRRLARGPGHAHGRLDHRGQLRAGARAARSRCRPHRLLVGRHSRQELDDRFCQEAPTPQARSSGALRRNHPAGDGHSDHGRRRHPGWIRRPRPF